jgi:enhancing lycopene biosynthesis protein 2
MDTLNDIISGLKWGNLDPIEAHDRVLTLFSVSQQSEPFINFAKEVIEYYEQHDIGDEDIYNKAKKLINGG